LHVARQALAVLEMSLQAVTYGNVNAISDGGAASALARAALTAAGYNVRINVTSLQDLSAGQAMLDELQELEGQADALEAQVRAQLVQRGGLPLQ
jgi:formiminotetrahydrofolate cyclodeaminase